LRRAILLQQKPLYEFGPFRLDTGSRRLFRGGEMVALTPKVLDILVVLVENNGHLLGKEELMKTVWADTFVEDGNVTQSISVLRKILGTAPGGESYIETVPKRGYCFRAEVRKLREGPVEVLLAERSGPNIVVEELVSIGAVATLKRWVGWVVLSAAFLALPTVWWIGERGGSEQERLTFMNATHTPFTSGHGYEGDPAISPDGRSIAYASDRAGRFDIFLRQIGAISAIALTHDQGDNIQPAFSPDGLKIAFVSSRAGSEIYHRSGDMPLVGGDVWVMPALGGAAQRIAEEGNFPKWSSDGSKILFVHRREKIYEVPATGGKPREIALQFSPGAKVFAPAYSADGRWIFFNSQSDTIFVAPAHGGTAKSLAKGWYPAWDDALSALVYSNSAEGKNNSLWSLPFSIKDGKVSGEPRPLTVGRGRDWQPTVSRDGRLVAFTAMDRTFNLETVRFDAEAGRLLGPPRELTNSTQVAYFASFSPEARSVVFESSQGAGTHVWRVDSGAEPVPLTADSKFEDTMPEWSPDGKIILFHVSSPKMRHSTREVYG
jgi:Tol biopolymer transport system component/DNA-binding winged helix-turn-helix (wHTH) protein